MSDRLDIPIEKLTLPTAAMIAVATMSILGFPKLMVIPLGIVALVWAMWVVASHYSGRTQNGES